MPFICPDYLSGEKIKTLASVMHRVPANTVNVFSPLFLLSVSDPHFDKDFAARFGYFRAFFDGYLREAAACILPDKFNADGVSTSQFEVSGDSTTISFMPYDQIVQSQERMIRLQMYICAVHDGRRHKWYAAGLALAGGLLIAADVVVVPRYVHSSDRFGTASLANQLLIALFAVVAGQSVAQLAKIKMAFSRLKYPKAPPSCLSLMKVMSLKKWLPPALAFGAFNVARDITPVAEMLYSGFKSLAAFIGVTFDLPLILMSVCVFMATLSWNLRAQDRQAEKAGIELKMMVHSSSGDSSESAAGRESGVSDPVRMSVPVPLTPAHAVDSSGDSIVRVPMSDSGTHNRLRSSSAQHNTSFQSDVSLFGRREPGDDATIELGS